jgi:hypothetical protein
VVICGVSKMAITHMLMLIRYTLRFLFCYGLHSVAFRYEIDEGGVFMEWHKKLV